MALNICFYYYSIITCSKRCCFLLIMPGPYVWLTTDIQCTWRLSGPDTLSLTWDTAPNCHWDLHTRAVALCCRPGNTMCWVQCSSGVNTNWSGGWRTGVSTASHTHARVGGTTVLALWGILKNILVSHLCFVSHMITGCCKIIHVCSSNRTQERWEFTE